MNSSETSEKMSPESIISRLIAGPCSAETPGQLCLTASSLRDMGVTRFRAGLWKPRTSPSSFEGVGEKGIPWMQEVKNRFGMRICTEVASARHVELCLKAGFDMLWIGARTTTNPFLVDEIAAALEGSDTAVFVKNPVNPDLGLWAGAVERLRMRDVKDISVIYRGVSSVNSMPYRNDPCWGFAVKFRSAFPDVPFYCDPSHIAGDRAYVGEIAQKAMDLGVDGLMLECHCNPEAALSDASQQLTADALGELLCSLEPRLNDSSEGMGKEAVEAARARIDTLDSKLVDILSERMEACREIGLVKKKDGVAILQTGRWDRVLSAVRERALQKGLDPDFIERIFAEIHDASVSVQNTIISK